MGQFATVRRSAAVASRGTAAAVRRAVAASALAALLLAPAAADAANPAPLGIACQTQSDGVRFCQGGTVPTFDGTPIDVNVTLPAVPASGTDGGYPLVIVGHGYGGQKQGLDGHEAPWIDTAHQWAQRGYVVLNNTDRGFWGSCGTPAARLTGGPACVAGYNRLMQAGYEVHDAQYLAGLLVDDGWADPLRIGAVGESYGGGESLLMATLKDRILTTSGAFAPWRSPKGVPLRLAGAAPTIPWSDLISSLMPNGHTLDYTITQPTDAFTPIGVEKLSFVAGLFATGEVNVGALTGGPSPAAPPNAVIGYYAPPQVDPNADLNSWYALINAGEPYDGNPLAQQIITSFQKYRGAYYLLDGHSAGGANSEAPAPMLLSNGFTDDLFPVDETVRYYNLEKSLYPNNPVSLLYMDYGHMRGQNKVADTGLLESKINAWFDHYVRGGAPDPGQAVTALTQTCPKSAPSGGPFTASTWVGIHPGILPVLFSAPQTISSAAGDPSVSAAVDPVGGGGDPCKTVAATDQGAGVASYRLPAATGGGYTMIGGPIVVAALGSVTGPFPQIDERLWDVAPSGSETLVARGDYRLSMPVDTATPVVFQLHPGAWHFAAGHVPKVELLGQDIPYLRRSNGAFTIAVKSVEVLLPTHETSGNGIEALGALPAPAGSVAAPSIRLEAASATLLRAARCVAARLRWALRYHGRGRVLSVVVTVNGRRVASAHGRNLRVIGLRRAPAGRSFTVRVMERTSKGLLITTTRRYRNCRALRTRMAVRRLRR